MTSFTRRSLAAAMIAAGLLTGGTTATAHADILDSLADIYASGASGGQVSKLLESAITLRNRGIPPSPGNQAALRAAMDQRPNLVPLTEALQATVAQQRQALQRAAAGKASPAPVGPAAPWDPPDPDNDQPLAPQGWGSSIAPFG